MANIYGTYPESSELRHDGENKRLIVGNRFYEVEHDLQQGGAMVGIRYPNGSNRNLLMSPVQARVELPDGPTYADLGESAPQVSSSTSEDEIRLTFSGLLRTPGGEEAGVHYTVDYVYRWGYVKVHRRFRFPDSGLPVSRLSAHSCMLRPELDHWGYRTAPEDEPGSNPFTFGLCRWGRMRPGTHFDWSPESRFVPRYVVNAEFGREGLEWFASSRLSEWAYQITGRAGCGFFTVAGDIPTGAINLEISPLHLPRSSYRVSGVLDFNYYLGFPLLSGRAPEPFLHEMYDRRWPDDDQIKTWADQGLRTAHFHHDGDRYSDGQFWRDCSYPPFGPEDMATYDRVIKTCHDHGIRVGTYFTNKEFHPTAAGYEENAEAWGRKADDLGRLHHNYMGPDEFGALMCLRSGWLEHFKEHVDTVLSNHDLDGVYYDWTAPLYCHNPLHVDADAADISRPALGAMALSPAGHWDMDELLDLMEWTRQRVGPDGMVHIHNTMTPCAAIENFSDYVVAMEWGYGNLVRSMPRPDELPLEWGFMGSRSRGIIEYGSVRGDTGATLRRQFQLSCLVTGTWPWTASEAALDLFAPFKGVDLSGYRLWDWRNRGLVTANPELATAVYTRGDEAFALVANLSDEPQQASVRLDPEAVGLPAGVTCRGVAGAGADNTFQLDLEATGLAVMEIR